MGYFQKGHFTLAPYFLQHCIRSHAPIQARRSTPTQRRGIHMDAWLIETATERENEKYK